MEPKSEPEIVNISKNIVKKASPKRYEKKVSNGTAKKQFECRPRFARVLISGQAGGRAVQVLGSILIQGGSYLI